jgi:KDO2-lipid IV(A) lauroyltransferase
MAIFLVKLLGRLPMSFLYAAVAPTIRFILFNLIGYRNKVITSNLSRALPLLSEQQRQAIAQQYQRHISELFVEIIKTRYHSAEQIAQRVTFRNPEVIEKHWRNNETIVILAMHQSNWEWLLHAAAIHLNKQVNIVYKPLHDAGFDQYFKQGRERFGCKTIAHKKILAEISQWQEQYFFGILSDQSPMKKSPKVWAPMLNIETAFPIGVEVIAKQGNATVIFCGMHKVSQGHYECWLEEIAQPPYAKGSHNILEGYADCCTRAIEQQPETWLWSNQRWRFGRDQDRYIAKPEHDI